MISHACGSCGKMLDSASRGYSGDLRMWIARCGRCGLAVRWSPRAAREPARIWARVRTLNLRLGVAFTLAQVAGLAIFIVAVYLDDTGLALNTTPVAEMLASPLLVAIALIAALSGAAGAVMAPHRPTLHRTAVAWIAGVLPVVLALGALSAPAIAFAATRGRPAAWSSLPFGYDHALVQTAIVALLAFALSLPIGALAGWFLAPIRATAVRRRARELRAASPMKSDRP